MKDHATEHYTPVRDFTLSTPTKYHSTTWHNPQPDAQNAADRDTTERCYHAIVSRAKVADLTSSAPRNQSTTAPYHNTGRTDVDALNVEDHKTTDQRGHSATAFQAKVTDLTSSAPRNQSTTAPYHNTGRTDVDARNVEDHKTTDQRGHSATAFQAKVADLTSSAQKNRTMDDYRLEMH